MIKLARKQQILAEVAKRLGFKVVPNKKSLLLYMLAGGVAAKAARAASPLLRNKMEKED